MVGIPKVRLEGFPVVRKGLKLERLFLTLTPCFGRKIAIEALSGAEWRIETRGGLPGLPWE